MKLPEDLDNLDKGRVIGILGLPGRGKTEDLKQIAGRSERPVLAIDTVGALTKGLEGTDSWLVNVPKGEPVERWWPQVKEWLQGGDRVVLNFKGWLPSELQTFLDKHLMDRIHELTNILVVVDEVHRIAPVASNEWGGGSAKFKDWMTTRRNMGVAVAWSSQRPAFVSMTIRGVTDGWLVHGLFYSNDLNVIKKLLQGEPGIDMDELGTNIRALPPGHALWIDLPFIA